MAGQPIFERIHYCELAVRDAPAAACAVAKHQIEGHGATIAYSGGNKVRQSLRTVQGGSAENIQVAEWQLHQCQQIQTLKDHRCPDKGGFRIFSAAPERFDTWRAPAQSDEARYASSIFAC